MSNQHTFVNIMNEFISDNEDEYSEVYSQNNNGKELKYESTSHLENNSVKKEKIANIPNNKDNKNNKNFKKDKFDYFINNDDKENGQSYQNNKENNINHFYEKVISGEEKIENNDYSEKRNIDFNNIDNQDNGDNIINCDEKTN